MSKPNSNLGIYGPSVIVALAAMIILIITLLIKATSQPPEVAEPRACEDVSIVHIYHAAQVGEWDRWEADAENAASVLVAKRMGGSLWERYQNVPNLQKQYRAAYQTALDYTQTSGEACVWAEQDALLQQLNATHMEIMTIYNDIVAADGNRR